MKIWVDKLLRHSACPFRLDDIRTASQWISLNIKCNLCQILKERNAEFGHTFGQSHFLNSFLMLINERLHSLIRKRHVCVHIKLFQHVFFLLCILGIETFKLNSNPLLKCENYNVYKIYTSTSIHMYVCTCMSCVCHSQSDFIFISAYVESTQLVSTLCNVCAPVCGHVCTSVFVTFTYVLSRAITAKQKQTPQVCAPNIIVRQPQQLDRAAQQTLNLPCGWVLWRLTAI